MARSLSLERRPASRRLKVEVPSALVGARVVGEEPRVRVRLPRALSEYAGGEETVELRGATLAEVIARLNERHPGLGYRLLDDQGRMRRYVLVFVNDDSVGDVGPDQVRLRDGDTVHILPSVAGG